MNLGLVGVGPWGRTLARKFTEAGAVIVAHCRVSSTPVDGYGIRMPVADMLRSSEIHGLVIAAPPRLTLEVALRAAAIGKAVMATKPLMLEKTIEIAAPFVVDHVRLWAPSYLRLKKAVRDSKVSKVVVEFFGQGPLRAFSGLDDYGSHALAFVHDLLWTDAELIVKFSRTLRRPNGTQLHFVEATVEGVDVTMTLGNGADAVGRRMVVTVADGTQFFYDEERWEDPLFSMAKEFLADVEADKKDRRSVELAVAVWRSLNTIRRDAELDL